MNTRAPGEGSPRDVIIVGGGLAGLACGVALANHGMRVTVIERDSIAGGRARSWTDAATGDRIDVGPHILLSQYRNMLRLLEQLDTATSIRWQGRDFVTLVDARQTITLHTYPLTPPLHLLPDLFRVRRLSLGDLASNTPTVWRAMRATPESLHTLDDHDAESLLLDWGATPRFIDWYWRTVSMAIMNVPLESCSSAALLRFFRYMAIRRDQQVGLPGIALGDLFVPGATRLIEAAGGDVRMQTGVRRVHADEQGFRAVALEDGGTLSAPRCVLAVPPAEVLALLPDAIADSPWFARFAGLRPSPYIAVYLWFDRRLGGEPFWTNTWSPRTCFYDFYDLARIRPGWESRGSVIACNLIHSDRAGHPGDDALVDIAREEFTAHVPGAREARLLHATVHRIPMAIPAPHPGSEALRPTTRTPVPGLLLAGDWIATELPCSMESAVRAGWCAAEAVLADSGIDAAIVSPLPQATGLARVIAA